MRNFILFAVIAMLMFTSGCTPESREEFSRYPAIEIPGYTEKDYYALLTDKNPTIVYNAVCNLGEFASSIAGLLSNDKVDKNSEQYILYSNIYQKITQLLQSRDRRIILSALRFLQLFGLDYKPKAELVEPILKIRSSAPSVNFEQLEALRRITSKDLPLKEDFVTKALKNRSWLVARSAYGLINALESEHLRQKIIESYKNTTDEMERLLMLNALKKRFSEGVFNFLSQELLSSQSEKIRLEIVNMLENAADENIVLTWLENNYARLPNDVAVNLFKRHCNDIKDGFSRQIVILLIKNGYALEEKHYLDWGWEILKYETYGELDDKDKEHQSALKQIEQAILAQEGPKAQWLSTMAKLEKKVILGQKMKTAYDNAIDVFLQNAAVVIQESSLSPEEQKEFLEELKKLKDFLPGESFDL
ncbi:MAG: hypothetical protein V1727_01400 [Candidatus Omnitrophota bacterium]